MTSQSGPEGATPAAADSASKLPVVTYIFAGAVMIAYGVALFLLWNRAGSPGLTWTRRLYLLGGIEALAFGAAGAIFGSSVQRRSTDREAGERARAERERDTERERADELAEQAATGQAVAAAITAKVATRQSEPQSSGQPQRYAGRASDPAADTLPAGGQQETELQTLLRQLEWLARGNPS